jgi:diphthine-ammonia ligase
MIVLDENMKLGVLFSGGKDSSYACFLAKRYGHEVSCLISIVSENPYSFMFHTPMIEKVQMLAEAMQIPIIVKRTRGEKEIELEDLRTAITNAKERYGIKGIVTGAVESVYQVTRIQKICDKLELECFNPLWQKDQIELLEDIIAAGFKVIVTGVFAYPFDKKWVGRKIDSRFISEMKGLKEKFKMNPAGEGGEFESLAIDGPVFKKTIILKNKKISGEKHSWRMGAEYEFGS